MGYVGGYFRKDGRYVKGHFRNDGGGGGVKGGEAGALILLVVVMAAIFTSAVIVCKGAYRIGASVLPIVSPVAIHIWTHLKDCGSWVARIVMVPVTWVLSIRYDFLDDTAADTNPLALTCKLIVLTIALLGIIVMIIKLVRLAA